MTDYTRTPPHQTTHQIVAITSVDTVGQSAEGIARTGNIIHIDTTHYVGAVQVTPSIGDQWYVQKINGIWRLLHRLPFNDPNNQLTTTQGQHTIGSGQGPIQLQGTVVNANAPLSLPSYSDSEGLFGLPNATKFPLGTLIYNVTHNQVQVANGNQWSPPGWLIYVLLRP